MATSGISPKRKRLKLCRNENQETEPNKLSKAESSNTEREAGKKNFMKACLKVSYEAYQDYKKRFQLLYVPGCMNNMCNHGDRNTNLKQISRSTEQIFKTEVKNNTLYEALEICLVCTTSCQYLSATILKDIVEIIMNAHEDLDTGYPIDYILRKCQHTLMIHFNMHPPCVTRAIKDCYKEFLTSPMDEKNLSNRELYQSREGIVSHCISRLIYEISMESNEGSLIEEQEIPTDIEGVKRLHWKKENLELFELLVRTERIERCMLVLESLIYLLQTNIAVWYARRNGNDSRMRSQRPLLADLMWPLNSLKHGTVTPQCKQIMELFAYFIHLQYPERHIKTMGLWMNAVVQLFYIYETHSGVDYPNTGKYCATFAKEFYKVISPLPNKSIKRILEKIQPSFMQYLIGKSLVQVILNFTQGEILHIMSWCIDNKPWDKYSVGDYEPTIHKESRLKPNKLLIYLSRKCRNYDVAIDLLQDTYPKLELTENDSKIKHDYITDMLFITFVAYLETYSFKNFYQTLEYYNENKNNSDPTSHEPYLVTDHFIKQYRSIFESLQELLVMLKKKKNDETSKKLLDLINIYFS